MTDERPVRTLSTRYIVETLYDHGWMPFITCKDAADGQRFISEFDPRFANTRPSRVVRVSTATERQVIG